MVEELDSVFTLLSASIGRGFDLVPWFPRLGQGKHGATEIMRYLFNKLAQITYLNSVVMPDDEDEDEVDDDEEDESVEVDD